MEFLAPELEEYVDSLSSPETSVLSKLNRETHANVVAPRMLSGHLQGRILAMLSRMISPLHILEIGTYTGYSAICLSEGLKEGGRLHTIEINTELGEMIRRYFAEAGVAQKIELHTGPAVSIIPTLNIIFDLVFIDADKENYSRYFDLCIGKVRQGGYIIADNVLWSGKVLGDELTMDAETKAIVAFSKKVHSDPRVENVLLPVRDGLMICRKLS